MKNVFVLGNGESRLQFPLEKLRTHGKIYGCNALYRDFAPDVLVAIDPHMVEEIISSGYHQTHVCCFANDQRAKTIPPHCLVGEYRKTQYCGPTAIRLAIANEGPENIYLIGFDIIERKWSNVYCGTRGYEDYSAQARQVVAAGSVVIHNKPTLQQLLDIFREFGSVNFFKVMDSNSFRYSVWEGQRNLVCLTADHFARSFNLDLLSLKGQPD